MRPEGLQAKSLPKREQTSLMLLIGNGNRDEARKVIKVAVTYGP
jgi:hypothetical protein